MKTLLTSIILILTIITLIFLLNPYFAHTVSNAKSVTSAVNTSVSTEAITAASDLVSLTAIHALSNTASDADKAKNNATQHESKISDINVSKLLTIASSHGLKPKALKSALNAYAWALHHGKLGKNKDILTVVDFTLPSYVKRMWVISLHQSKVLMNLYTTQGAGSGLVYASRFSNTNKTQASSLGLYVTSDEYYGGHGKSMRLDGLQKGINSNARQRTIVIHEAAYASPAYIKANHRAGRSWGCFAVAPSSKNALLSYVKGGSALFAYAHAIEKHPIVSNGPISI